MGERIEHCKPMEYFLRRTNRVFYSWLFWVAVYIALIASAALLNHGTRSLDLSLIQKTLYSDVVTSLFHSAYWFVPNFLVSIGILLIFRRYLYTLKFGICLLALSLIYVVNIYTLWFPSLHTQAIFGFVFYLWLGSYIAHNFQRFSQTMARIPISVLTALTVFTVVLSFSESCLLRTLHNPDPTNTLRASNQLFSVCVALLLFKFTRATWPRFIDVRRYTFGLYLAHTVVIFFILGGLKFVFRHFHLVAASNLQYLCLATVFTFATYFGSLGVTAWIARKPALQWIIGIKSQNPPPSSIAQTLESPTLVHG